MRIVLTTGFYNRRLSAEQIITRRIAFHRFAQELQKLGHELVVMYPFKHDAELNRGGVAYRFVRASAWARWLAFGRSDRELATRMLPVVADFAPDIIHFSGLTLDLNLWLVSRWGRRAGVPVVVQYHGGRPATNLLRRTIQRGNVRRATRLLLTAPEQADGWPVEDKVELITEMSSDFRPMPNSDLTGEPVILCASQLVERKRPLTVLRGMVELVQERPRAHLHWAFHTATLLPTVEQFIADHGLREHVTLLGNVPHAAMERLYGAADFFVQASDEEVASIAVLEAMACDVTPVLSDIAPFRRLTDRGRFGRLFPLDDPQAMANAFLLGKHNGVRAHFLSIHSYSVLARQLEEVYRRAREDSGER